MRLLTHNMLCCLKCDHFPLQIKADEIENENANANSNSSSNINNNNNNNINNNNNSSREKKSEKKIESEDENDEGEEGAEEEDEEDDQNQPVEDSEEDKRAFIIHMLPTLDWPALVAGASDVSRHKNKLCQNKTKQKKIQFFGFF